MISIVDARRPLVDLLVAGTLRRIPLDRLADVSRSDVIAALIDTGEEDTDIGIEEAVEDAALSIVLRLRRREILRANGDL